MSAPAPSERSRVRRLPLRAAYDRPTIDAILDEGLVAHVGLSLEGQPVVVPMVYGRWGDELVLHGSPASRSLRALAAGAEAVACVTLLDGLVLARSTFHHSLNYRSVVVHGRARAIEDAEEKARALEAVVEHVVPGRSAEARPANAKELRGTAVVALALDEASAKLREGPPVDEEEDLALDVWAGVLPLGWAVGAPRPDPLLAAEAALSPSARRWRRGVER